MAASNTKKTIAAAAVAAGVAAMLAIAFMGYSPSPLAQNAMAQSDDDGDATPEQSTTQGVRRSLTYFATEMAPVSADGNATAQAMCQSGDVLLTGGYTIGGFDSAQSVFNSVLFSNTALRTQNQTGAYEGWEAGLVNLGTAGLTITANAVCLDVTPDAG